MFEKLDTKTISVIIKILNRVVLHREMCRNGEQCRPYQTALSEAVWSRLLQRQSDLGSYRGSLIWAPSEAVWSGLLQRSDPGSYRSSLILAPTEAVRSGLLQRQSDPGVHCLPTHLFVWKLRTITMMLKQRKFCELGLLTKSTQAFCFNVL